MKLNITSMDHLGRGIAKIDNKVIFIPKTIPGDIIDAEIIKNYKNYDLGKLNKIIEPSRDRIQAKCPYYEVCGGCHISNLSYQQQLLFKENKVKNIFKKYLNIDINPNVIGSVNKVGYRNKITYHMKDSLGLIGEYSNVIDIDKCLLVSDKVNNLYKEIKKADLSLVNKITIKECDNGLILIINGKMNIDNLKVLCIGIYQNNECLYYKEDGYIYLNDIKYLISPKSFFQINTANITKLYDEIVRLANFNQDDSVIDLYCGVGSISLYVSKYVKKVLGIEIIKDAVRDAKKNAEINHIDNTEFICSDVAKINDNLIDSDILIVDPPRTGLDKHTIGIINNKKINKLIYVSCEPMTLVRDLKLLDNYQFKDISIIDMFPETHHCESITVLERR